MGLYQDNFTGLSELERLAAMAHDPVRVLEIGADQWPLTMMACGLMASNDEEKLEENFDIYDIFASRTTVAARNCYEQCKAKCPTSALVTNKTVEMRLTLLDVDAPTQIAPVPAETDTKEQTNPFDSPFGDVPTVGDTTFNAGL
jgi:hypothetical protein